MTTNKQESLLEQIHFPSDLRNLSADRLEDVCAELRRYIIDVLSKTPGHLGAYCRTGRSIALRIRHPS